MRLAVLLLLAATALLPARAAETDTTTQQARVIVRFKADADSVKARRMQARMNRFEALDVAQTRATGLGQRHGLSGGRLKARMSLDERTHVVVASGMTSAQLVQKLSADAEVEFAVVDGIRKRAAVPNDLYYLNGSGSVPAVGQWYLRAPAGEVVSSINAPGAWDVTMGSPNVIVAVIDTGVRKDHPDLAGQFIGGYDFVAFSNSNSSVALATANDGDAGDADASDPGDWVSQADITSGKLGSSCTSADIGDSSWHGTHVSGLIAAITNNSTGMAGVAGNVKVLPVRVLGKCGGYDSDIIAGMKWAAGVHFDGMTDNPNPAKVLNMSLGGVGNCTGNTGTLYNAAIADINAKGATVVVAAGNGEGLAVGVPGNCAGVITVAALRHVGSKVGFSNVGTQVSISAPGGNCVNLTGACLYPILSASNSGAQGPNPGENNYDAGVGTSFSTPLVAGTVALMYSIDPTMNSTKVTSVLKATARPFVTSGATAGTIACRAPTSIVQDECYCTTSTCGAGMLDAAAAVASVVATAGSVSIGASASPTAGQTVTLTGTATLAGARTVASWAWTLVDGGGAVTAFTGATNGATATLSPTAAGTVSVKVQATDGQGTVYTATSSIVVAAAPVVTTPVVTPPNTSSGGGGGAVSPVWLLGLMLAALALRRQPR